MGIRRAALARGDEFKNEIILLARLGTVAWFLRFR
jgi:hypothetical protein